MSVLDDLQTAVANFLANAEAVVAETFESGDEAVNAAHRVLALTGDASFRQAAERAGVDLDALDKTAIETVQKLSLDLDGLSVFLVPMTRALRALRELVLDILGGGVPIAEFQGTAEGFAGETIPDTVQIQQAGFWVPFIGTAVVGVGIFTAIWVASGYVNSWADPMFARVESTAEKLIAAGEEALAAQLVGGVAAAIAETQVATGAGTTIGLITIGSILTVGALFVILRPARKT